MKIISLCMSMLAGVSIALASPAAPANAQGAKASDPNARYYCYDEDRAGYILFLKPGGIAEARADDGSNEVITGTHSRRGQSLSLTLPAIGFAETAPSVYTYKSLIIAFETPSVWCKLTGHDVGPKVEGYARCPNIGYYASGGGYETNHFQFFEDGAVRRYQTQEYTITSSTRRNEMFGSYLIEGDQLFMAFADDEDKPLLTAQIHGDQSFTVAELEPDKGPCVPD